MFKSLILHTGLRNLEGLKRKEAQLYQRTAGNTENKQNPSKNFTTLSKEGSVYHQLGGDKQQLCGNLFVVFGAKMQSSVSRKFW